MAGFGQERRGSRRDPAILAGFRTRQQPTRGGRLTHTVATCQAEGRMAVRTRVVCTMALLLGCGDDVQPATDETGTSSSSTAFPMTCGVETTCMPTGAQTSVEPETTVDPDSTSTGTSDTGESTGTTGELFDPFGAGVEVPIDLGFEPLALALADFDGDGVLDLLVTGTSASIVTGATLLGDGMGGFGAPIDAGVTACSAFPIFGAIDDDAAADLFFGTCGVDAVAYTADGDGTFTPIDLLDDWSFPPVRSSKLADHDGDGDDDLVLLTVDMMNQVRVHVAQGGAAPWPVTTTAVDVADAPDFAPNNLATADLDADAFADAVLVQADTAAAWTRGLDPGHEAAGNLLELSLAPATITARRLLGDDDRDDVVIASRMESVLQVIRGGDGAPEQPGDPIDLGGLAPLELAIGDFDGDGDDDLATVDVTLPTFLVLEGEGAAAFTTGPEHDLPSLAVRLLAGDLNADGRSDLVAATFPNGSITVLLAQ
ncbi:MAG TPA: hypothetical protein VG755_39345 [Nannocystaceae bacterium]|nr:hypothetical protein [Nannocystaceae bacterium]